MGPGAAPRQPFDSLDVTLSQIKRVETDKSVIKLNLADQEIHAGPPSTCFRLHPSRVHRRAGFANNYTRLFMRYPDWRIPSWEPKA